MVLAPPGSSFPRAFDRAVIERQPVAAGSEAAGSRFWAAHLRNRSLCHFAGLETASVEWSPCHNQAVAGGNDRPLVEVRGGSCSSRPERLLSLEVLRRTGWDRMK